MPFVYCIFGLIQTRHSRIQKCLALSCILRPKHIPTFVTSISVLVIGRSGPSLIAIRKALTGDGSITKKKKKLSNKMDTEDEPSGKKERFCFIKQTWKLEKPPEGAVLLPPSALCKRKLGQFYLLLSFLSAGVRMLLYPIITHI